MRVFGFGGRCIRGGGCGSVNRDGIIVRARVILLEWKLRGLGPAV